MCFSEKLSVGSTTVINGALSIGNTVVSSSTYSIGGLTTFASSLSIGGDTKITGNIVLGGNLIILGNATKLDIHSEKVVVQDNMLFLNANLSSLNQSENDIGWFGQTTEVDQSHMLELYMTQVYQQLKLFTTSFWINNKRNLKILDQV